MMYVEKNIFVMFLKMLNVKYTNNFSNKYFEEHPYKNSLYGLSKMLTDYGVENVALRFDQKENSQVLALQTPFVAHTHSDFILVYRVTPSSVYYYWNGKTISITLEQFVKIWSGVVLLAEVDKENSIEPDYHDHLRKTLYENALDILLKIVLFLLFFVVYVQKELYVDYKLNLFLIINMLGIFVSSLLLSKQIYRHSQYGDKICTLFKQSDCNNILDTKASKLWGTNISWSEIGVGYFISNILVLFFAASLLPYAYLINIVILPYSFWSVWYQKVRQRQWCLLCLFVQVLIWVLFLSDLLLGQISWPVLSLQPIILAACIYLIPLLFFNRLSYLLSENSRIGLVVQKMNSLKAREDVFLVLLKSEQRFDVSKDISHIKWGNPHADLQITILTNPYCNPCSAVHEQVSDFLITTDNNKFFVQYVFSSFNNDLKDTNRYLISAYLNNELGVASEIIHDWYRGGKKMKEDFFVKYGVLIDEKSKREYESHEKWILETGLNETPTILVNGYKLPVDYKVADLKYFLDLKIR